MKELNNLTNFTLPYFLLLIFCLLSQVYGTFPDTPSTTNCQSLNNFLSGLAFPLDELMTKDHLLELFEVDGE